METMKLNQEEADNLVINTLIETTDCGYDLEIITHSENNKFFYEISEKQIIRGKEAVRKINLKKLEYIKLLKIALLKKGYRVTFVKPHFRKNKVSYEVLFYLLEQQEVMARKRKKI